MSDSTFNIDYCYIDEVKIDHLLDGESLICPRGWKLCKKVGFSDNLQMHVLKCDSRTCFLRKNRDVFIPVLL